MQATLATKCSTRAQTRLSCHSHMIIWPTRMRQHNSLRGSSYSVLVACNPTAEESARTLVAKTRIERTGSDSCLRFDARPLTDWLTDTNRSFRARHSCSRPIFSLEASPHHTNLLAYWSSALSADNRQNEARQVSPALHPRAKPAAC